MHSEMNLYNVPKCDHCQNLKSIMQPGGQYKWVLPISRFVKFEAPRA